MNSLRLARQNGCESVAFPLISSGIYGYPKDQALAVATGAISEFLQNDDMIVYLVVFDQEAFILSEKLLGAVSAYIDEHYVDEHLDKDRRRRLLEAEKRAFKENIRTSAGIIQPSVSEHDQLADTVKRRRNLPDVEKVDTKESPPFCLSAEPSVDYLMGQLDESFSQTLLRLIDAKGKTDVEVYKRANMDRKLFSKIRSSAEYTPSKKTVIALAVALELDLAETGDLLARAGYALSHSQKFDVIIEYFIIHGRYDILEINEVLFYYDQPLLGSLRQ